MIKVVALLLDDGFCDYDLNATSNHGRFNWSEVAVNETDEQECFYNPKGKARRKCIGPGEWDSYNGTECITENTFRLLQLPVCFHGYMAIIYH